MEEKKPVKPITPAETLKDFKESFPDYVITGINNAILKYSKGQTSFTIYQKNIVEEIIAAAKPKKITSKFLFDNHFLDFEDMYRQHGWYIEYDKPGYCESYEAFFKFKMTAKG